MSQIPPPNDPLPYATPQFQTPSPRPTSVTVLAILAIIFGILGLLSMICSLPQYLGLQMMPNPVIDGIRADGLLLSITVGSLVVGLVMSILLLWSGIGLLSLKASARKMIICYAILYFVTSVIGIILNVAITGPRTQQIVQKAALTNPQLNTPAMKSIMQYSSYGGVCFSIVLLIWPALILYFMSRPHVKAAFERGSGGVDLMPPS